MTLESLMDQIRRELARSSKPIDVKRLVATHCPHDIEAGRLLSRAFHVGLLRGRLHTKMVEFDGHISGIADDTRPVWH